MTTDSATGRVTIRHPQAGMLVPVAEAWNDTHRGRWGIAAMLCEQRLNDADQAAQTLNEIGATFRADEGRFAPLAVVEFPAAVTFLADTRQTASALDLFMRILCGQWNEMRFYCTLARDERLPDVDLTVLRVGFTRSYDDTVPWDERAFPPHPGASISIAQAPLAARIAYHAYKALGAGAPGSPTFSLPDGPVEVKVEK